MLHTFVRTAEARFAEWKEFEGLDGPEPLWRIPAHRMKRYRPYLVPLTPTVVGILNELRKYSWPDSRYVFPAPTKTGVISENTMIYGLYRMGYHSRATIHGFRGTASTILNESNKFNKDWIEKQLSHDDDDAVRSAYNAAEWLDDRRKMMLWWSEFRFFRNSRRAGSPSRFMRRVRLTGSSFCAPVFLALPDLASVVPAGGVTVEAGMFLDYGTKQVHAYTAWGWQLGFNAGVSSQVGYFSGNWEAFTGKAVEIQGSVGVVSITILVTRDAENKLQWGLAAGPGFGLPLGLSVGRTTTYEWELPNTTSVTKTVPSRTTIAAKTTPSRTTAVAKTSVNPAQGRLETGALNTSVTDQSGQPPRPEKPRPSVSE